MRWLLVASSLLVAACGDDSSSPDASPPDAATPDATIDGPLADATVPDAAVDATNDRTPIDASVGQEVELYRYLDFPFDAPGQAAPFDVVATATWTHAESGTQHVSEAFYNGADQYVFRLGASLPGAWTAVTESDLSALDDHRLEATVVPSTSAERVGFTGRLSGDPQAWAHQSGPEGELAEFVPILIMWNHPSHFFDEAEQEARDIEAFGTRHGFNGCHVPSIAAAWFGADRSGDIEASDETPDLRTFEALERLIGRWADRGGHVLLAMWHQIRAIPNRLSGGADGPASRRLTRYIAARLGPVAGWSMEYGIDLDEWVRPGQFEAWQQRLANRLGWHHYIGGRYSDRGNPGPTNRGEVTADGRSFNSQAVGDVGFAGWEHWLSELDANDLETTRTAIADRPHASLDRFRRRN
ncbi:MAG: hypothetical protein AAGF12_43900, partial [Myxococcota bacterium]